MVFGIQTELINRTIPSPLDASRSDAAGNQRRSDFTERLLQDKRSREDSGPRSENMVGHELVIPADTLLVVRPTSPPPEIAPTTGQTTLAPPDPAGTTTGLTELGQVDPAQEGLPANAAILPGDADIAEASAPSTSEHSETATPVTGEIARSSNHQDMPPSATDKGKVELALPMAASIGHTRQATRSHASESANLPRPATAMDDRSRAVEHPGHDFDGRQFDLSEPRIAATDFATTIQSHIPVDQPGLAENVSSPVQLTLVGLVAAPPSNAPISTAMVPVLGLVSASPVEVIEIISDKLAAPDDRRDRIVVQLNPVELGRVSVDFKFDAQGLQHVTITGETPDALRQLRSLHFELIQALEHQGLTGQSMTFQHEQRDAHDTLPDLKPTGKLAISEPEQQAADRSRKINIATSNSLNIKV